MNSQTRLHKLSHLKWLFMAAQVILIGYILFALPLNIITLIGIVVFLAGIQLGLDSFRDISKMSANEKNRFKVKKKVQRMNRVVFIYILVLIVLSVIFMSLKFFFPVKNKVLFEEFFHLGLNCWVLILGLLCVLKSNLEKYYYTVSKSASTE